MAYERDLGYLDVVDLELCVWVRLLCLEDLFYGDWSESIFSVCSLRKCQTNAGL